MSSSSSASFAVAWAALSASSSPSAASAEPSAASAPSVASPPSAGADSFTRHSRPCEVSPIGESASLWSSASCSSERICAPPEPGVSPSNTKRMFAASSCSCSSDAPRLASDPTSSESACSSEAFAAVSCAVRTRSRVRVLPPRNCARSSSSPSGVMTRACCVGLIANSASMTAGIGCRSTVSGLSARTCCTIVGRPSKTTPTMATMATGTSARSSDFRPKEANEMRPIQYSARPAPAETATSSEPSGTSSRCGATIAVSMPRMVMSPSMMVRLTGPVHAPTTARIARGATRHMATIHGEAQLSTPMRLRAPGRPPRPASGKPSSMSAGAAAVCCSGADGSANMSRGRPEATALSMRGTPRARGTIAIAQSFEAPRG